MKNQRPAFAFKLAIAIIILLSIAILALIYVLNTINSGENPYMEAQPAPKLHESTVIAGQTTSSYLNILENYKEISMEEISQDEAKEENRVSLVSQKSEASKNSISSRIDDIVNKASKK